MDENQVNPFPEEFDTQDVVREEEEEKNVIKKEQISDENSKNISLFDLDLESLDNYDEKEVAKQKFRSFNEDNSFDSVSAIPEDLKDELNFRGINEDVNNESLTDQEILRREFRDFLLLKKISGNLWGVSHTNKIPSEKVTESTHKIMIEDDPYISELDESKKSSSLIVHRNELDEIDYIEVLCSCGEKTTIRFNREDSSYNMRPDAVISGDYDPNETINAFDVKHNKEILENDSSTEENESYNDLEEIELSESDEDSVINPESD